MYFFINTFAHIFDTFTVVFYSSIHLQLYFIRHLCTYTAFDIFPVVFFYQYICTYIWYISSYILFINTFTHIFDTFSFIFYLSMHLHIYLTHFQLYFIHQYIYAYIWHIFLHILFINAFSHIFDTFSIAFHLSIRFQLHFIYQYVSSSISFINTIPFLFYLRVCTFTLSLI